MNYTDIIKKFNSQIKREMKQLDTKNIKDTQSYWEREFFKETYLLTPSDWKHIRDDYYFGLNTKRDKLFHIKQKL